MGTERRRPVYPRTVAEVGRQLAPWLAVTAVLLVVQWLLVVLLDDINVLRLTENARTVYRRFGDVRPVDGLFSVLTLLLTAVGVGACVLTAMLPHLRRDDRLFAASIGVQFLLLGVEEQLQLHKLLGELLGSRLVALSLHLVVAVAIARRWPRRVLRVWPLIAVAGTSLVGAMAIDALQSDARVLMYAEEWLELLGGVFLSGIALTLSRQAIVDATRSRRFAASSVDPAGPIDPAGPT